MSDVWVLWSQATRGVLRGLLALVAGVLLFEMIQPVAIKSFGDLDRMIAILPLVPRQFFALMNVSPTFLEGGGLPAFLTLGFSHPVYHLLSAATVIWVAGRGLAGEMERGSIQLALSRPVSRTSFYMSRVLTMLTAALLVAIAGPLGMWIGLELARPEGTFQREHFLAQSGYSFLLLCCVGGVAILISAAASRLGQAVGVAIALFVVSYVVEYFANFWRALEPIAPFSLFNYYDPGAALTLGQIRANDALILVSVAALAIVVGQQLFHRRDLPS